MPLYTTNERNAMKIDIDGLNEDELIELNHKVVARLRFLREIRSHAAMLDFRIGEKVRFHPDGHEELTGTIVKYNKRTVTVITEGGQHWNVSPGFLKKVAAAQQGTSNSVVVQIFDHEK
jgi:hypothetical protein